MEAPSPPAAERPRASPGVLVGLGLVTLAMLLFELTLTRVYSASMGYHLAFVAISVALFGTAAAAVIIDLRPAWFPPGKTRVRMAQAAIAFAITSVLAFRGSTGFRVHVQMGVFEPQLLLLYLVSAVPMLCAGFVVCLALSRHRDIGVVYAADLGGAAAGCVLFVLIAGIGDAPAPIALAGAALLAGGGWKARLPRAALILAAAVVVLSVAGERSGLLRMRFRVPASDLYVDPIYDRFNAFSRVVVIPSIDVPFGWGLSDRLPREHRAVQRSVFIDSTAGTVLTEFRGDWKAFEHLKYDITNLAHRVRRGGRVYIMGVGGGRDIASALLFGAKKVVAAEINPTIVDMLRRVFADFTGHIAQDPRVELSVDDARARMERMGDQEGFDVVMASLTDTWAATSSGAYTLTENPLYTLEGWRTFIGHLAPDGILTFSRWWSFTSPAEDLRLVTLARAALGEHRIADADKHVVLIGVKPQGWVDMGVATVLVKRTPWKPDELAILDQAVKDLGFEWMLDPRGRGLEPYREALVTPDPRGFLERYPRDVRPPTDDRPFYFLFTKVRDFWRVIGRAPGADVARLGDGPLPVLFTLTLVTIVLAACFILGPMAVRRAHERRSGLEGAPATRWDLGLFLAIGIGFILVEIAQIQRLSLLLGHPSYSLSVVLATLLLTAGAGSLLTERFPWPQGGGAAADALRRRRVLPLGAAIAGTILVIGLVTPAVVDLGVRHRLAVRILLAVVLVAPIGLVMGMVLPLGVRSLGLRNPREVPWMWAINGAVSVFASVLATLLSIIFGIAATYLIGAVLYVAAAALLHRLSRLDAAQARPAPAGEAASARGQGSPGAIEAQR